jgi:hypothetical protein
VADGRSPSDPERSEDLVILKWTLSTVAASVVAASLAVPAYSAAKPANKPDRAARAVLWRDPGRIEQKDLFWGPGSPARQPTPPFKLVKEKLSGISSKVVVTDARRASWDVKFGEEAHAEVIANRLVWALGYLAQEMYFVPEGRIEGVTTLKRAGDYVAADGRFHEARFRRRDPRLDEKGGWSFQSNPFVGKRELSGLVILMALVNNWDTEADRNQKRFRVSEPKGPPEDWYIAKDLGASFGQFIGPQGTPIKWFLPGYQQDGIVQRVEGGVVHLVYPAFGPPLDQVPLEHARWFADLAGHLTSGQIHRAFEAGGATPEQVDGFAYKLSGKIAELRRAVASARAPETAARGGP